MSGAEYFDDGFAINAYMDDSVPVDINKAKAEHREIKACFEKAGITVVKVDAPADCQDGVYTANWGLVRGKKVVMSNLPNKRRAEEPYAEDMLRAQGKEIIHLPKEFRFSGQGDALPCGNLLFVGSEYRTSVEVHPLLARELGYEVIGLQTVPQYDDNQRPVTNPVTGWPDSFFYDIDLALAIIKGSSKTKCSVCLKATGADAVSEQAARCECQGLIAWCPDAFMPESQERIRALKDVETIEVSLEEAMNGFACNLVSTGEAVVMSDTAPELKAALESRGLRVYTPHVTELLKGGGFIRCTSLSL